MQIKKCDAEDAPKLAILNRRLIEDEKSENPMSIDELEIRMKEFLETDYDAYFFVEDGQTIGYALVKNSSEPKYLRQFFIERNHRKKRLGTKAFQTLAQYLDIEETDLEVLPWNERGRNFWKSCGFRETCVAMRYKKRPAEKQKTCRANQKITKAEIIEKYFQAWINDDIEFVKENFSENAFYSECYGPEYRGLAQILKWFEDWQKKGRVLEWKIKRTFEQNQTLTVEWHFKCDYDGKADEFDGATIADFDDDMKISKICEFQSKSEHFCPYE